MNRALMLYLAVAILAVSSAVVRKLTELGSANLVEGRNPISFCNVLFAGNLVALVLLVALHHRAWNREALARVSIREWLSLTSVAILAVAAAPALIFTALDRTSVTSVVLLGRIEPPLVFLLGIWILRERFQPWVAAGSAVALIGVSLSVFLQPMADGLMFGRGELYALLGAGCLALATIITKAGGNQVPLGVFAVFRMAIGTAFFGAVVFVMFGPEHFMDLLQPFLWKWMLLYGSLIVTAGQLLWFAALRHNPTHKVTLATSISPIVAVLAAFAILGEIPMFAQFIGGGVILLGIGIGLVGQRSSDRDRALETENYDRDVGFKGI